MMTRAKTCAKCGWHFPDIPMRAEPHGFGDDPFDGAYYTCPEPCGSTHFWTWAELIAFSRELTPEAA